MSAASPGRRAGHGSLRDLDLRSRLGPRPGRDGTGHRALRRALGRPGRERGDARGLRPDAAGHGHVDPRRHHHRRPVHRRQGGGGRLLRDRGPRPGRRPGHRPHQSRRPGRRRGRGPAGAQQLPEGPGAGHPVTDTAAVEAVIADAHRHEWGRVLAATARTARDLDLAEECVQEAYAAALRAWGSTGIPANPAAWLTTAARRRAIDAIRREAALRSRLPLLVEPGQDLTETSTDEASTEEAAVHELAAVAPSDAIPDERLRLIFTCCHPALAQDAQVALTLRLLCGIPTADIARSFLVPEPTMAARITRAKKKIAVARIPYRVPGPAELPGRLRAVLAVIHLLFTAGHTAPSGASLIRADLVDRALHLARMLDELMPGETEVRGLLALLLVTDARRATRTDAAGRLVRLEDQDRSAWDRAALAEADA